MEEKDKKLIEEANSTIKKVRDTLFELFETVEKVQDIVDQISGLSSIEKEVKEKPKKKKTKVTKNIDWKEFLEKIGKIPPVYPAPEKSGDNIWKKDRIIWRNDRIAPYEPRIIFGTDSNTGLPLLEKFIKGYNNYKARIT